MAIRWYSDPALLCEREDNRRACPVCVHNQYSQDKPTDRRSYYCDVGIDQLGGSRTQQNCWEWEARGQNK